MHDLVRDMGREIVRSESEEPEKRSRLWHHKDSFKVLREKNGTQTICGLVLNMFPADTTSMNSDEMVFETEAFTRMHKLKLLHLSHVQLNGSYAEFPTELRWLCWHEFSLNSIPINFPLENLVVLEMHHSCLRQVWKGTKCLPSLKILDLSHSHDLRESVADFSLFPNLEKLILVDCRNLIDVHESIESLEKLVYLNMKDCKSIRMLNKNIGKLKLLKTLIISGCSNLNESSVDMMRNMESLKVLEADEIPVNQVLTAGGQLIESWPARSSYIFWTSLPCSLVSLSLSGRNLSNEDFPMELGNLSSLEKLNLQSTSVCSLPSCIKGLKKLCELNFGGCKSLKELVGLPKVKHVFVTDCTSLEKVTYESFSSYKNSLILFRHNRSLVEAEYMFRLEPIGKVDTEMINLLELRNYLESTATIKMHVPFSYGKISQDYESRPIQGLYEYGIFSTFLQGNQVPGRFDHRSSDAGTSISCRVPSLPPNYVIRGLNIFAVYALSEHSSFYAFDNPLFKKVWNKSKSLKWIYNPQVYGIPREGEDMVWLSHWKLEGELLGGNEVVVSVFMQPGVFHLKEFGVQLVCEKHENNITSKQHNTWTDPYYPRVIRGDLSSREATEGTYWLCWRPHSPEAIAWFDYLDRDFDDHELDTVTQLGEEQEEEEEEEEEKQLQDDPMLLPAATGRLTSDSEDENNGSKNDIEISESSKKGSQGNDNDVQSAAKDVADEELMQCLEILNNMEELDDDTYSKALKLFHDDATWRKLFVSMPDKRKKPFILRLGSPTETTHLVVSEAGMCSCWLRLPSFSFALNPLALSFLGYERRLV
ncbi:hypothetical protein EV2_024579 [Malus domestica]